MPNPENTLPLTFSEQQMYIIIIIIIIMIIIIIIIIVCNLNRNIFNLDFLDWYYHKKFLLLLLDCTVLLLINIGSSIVKLSSLNKRP